MAQVPSGRVITGAHNWKCNLGWEATDVLVLEEGVQQRITPEVLQKMGVPGIKKMWKVIRPRIGTSRDLVALCISCVAAVVGYNPALALTCIYFPQCFVNSIAACLAGAWKDESGEAGQRVQVQPSPIH